MTPTNKQLDYLYRLISWDGGKHLSPDIYVALIEAVRRGRGLI